MTKQALRAFYAKHHKDDGTSSAEWDAYTDALIAAGCPNFDCWQQADAMMHGVDPRQAAIEINTEADSELPEFYDPLDHDYSMNG